MAEVLREQVGVDVELVRGGRGIFEVAVAGRVVARKTLDGFPTPEQCVAAVRKAVSA